MPGEVNFLHEFIDKHFSANSEQVLIGELLTKVFESMKLAGEAGTLLKIEEIISNSISEAKVQWLDGPKYKQGLLFKGNFEPTEQLELKLDVSGITDETFWIKAEERIYNALKTYSESVEVSYQHRLFADDAARGFAFIDLCRKQYDTVLMNPPFGEWSKPYKAESKKAYPNSYNDILAAFVDRGGQMMVSGGQLGAITSRTCFFLSSYTKWREKVVLDLLQPRLLVDLGHGVMDAAMVEAAAYVLEKPLAKNTQ
jgi:hypothetical protein